MRLYPLVHLWDWTCAIGRSVRWCRRQIDGRREVGRMFKRGRARWPS